eukprot:TRINITY_DN11824_c0_g5_i1.p1 TRINITY_DN11824_c0_g5~~TRINITY_DN11824_c0_g5_i1.p1  ORF type:complete len:186 (-),score=22.44 TRINITY_DN11824_c0_g5_i1:393-950(-)
MEITEALRRTAERREEYVPLTFTEVNNEQRTFVDSREDSKDELYGRGRRPRTFVQSRGSFHGMTLQKKGFTVCGTANSLRADPYRKELKAIQERYKLSENQIIEVRNKFKALLVLVSNCSQADYCTLPCITIVIPLSIVEKYTALFKWTHNDMTLKILSAISIFINDCRERFVCVAREYNFCCLS